MHCSSILLIILVVVAMRNDNNNNIISKIFVFGCLSLTETGIEKLITATAPMSDETSERKK
jgi:hypothetical protein